MQQDALGGDGALRHGAATRPALAGAAAGLMSAALAAVLYAAHCFDDSPLFVITWYSLAIGAVTALGAFFTFSLWKMALLGLCLARSATLGGLVESIIKRHTGIKDSGSLIPGHGGVLDRFDSTLFTMPFMYYFIQICKLAG